MKNEILNGVITTYWWNFNEKTKDFHGTYKEWFDKNNISFYVRKNYIFFKGIFGSLTFNLKLRYNYEYSFIFIIKLCLSYLGDKALLNDSFNNNHKINWK